MLSSNLASPSFVPIHLLLLLSTTIDVTQLIGIPELDVLNIDQLFPSYLTNPKSSVPSQKVLLESTAIEKILFIGSKVFPLLKNFMSPLSFQS